MRTAKTKKGKKNAKTQDKARKYFVDKNQKEIKPVLTFQGNTRKKCINAY